MSGDRHVGMIGPTLVATRVGNHLLLTMGRGQHEFFDKLVAVAAKEASGILFCTRWRVVNVTMTMRANESPEQGIVSVNLENTTPHK